MGPRAGLDGRKISPHRDSIPGPSSPYPVAIPTELPGPPDFNIIILRVTANPIPLCTSLNFYNHFYFINPKFHNHCLPLFFNTSTTIEKHDS